LVTIFQAAAPAIQEECKKLALIDVDRFNRECVRRRIWEKAMGAVSQSNSPLVSPAVASAASTAIGVSSNSGTALPTSERIAGQQSGLAQAGSNPQGGGSSASSSWSEREKNEFLQASSGANIDIGHVRPVTASLFARFEGCDMTLMENCW
jgi:hypothetical protein